MADRDPVIVGVVVVPDEVLAKELELKVDGLASRADESRVVVVGATVADASPWRVVDGFTTVPSPSAWDPVEVPIDSEALEAGAFGFVTSDCAVGGDGAGVTVWVVRKVKGFAVVQVNPRPENAECRFRTRLRPGSR